MDFKVCSTRDFRIDVKQFIRDIEERPEIWSRRSSRTAVSHKVAFERAWRELEVLHKFPVAVLKTKWNSLRDKFRVEYKKRPLDTTSDRYVTAADFKSKWMHYNDLLFMAPLLEGQNFEKKQWNVVMYDESENMTAESHDSDGEDIEIDLPATSETTIMRLKPLATLQVNAVSPPQPKSFELPAKTKVKGKAAEMDEDQHFLMSLRPYLAQLDRVQKLKVRMEIEKLICKEIEFGK